MDLNQSDLKDFLDEKVVRYNQASFIESDPIQIPHQYSLKEDIEIAGFLTATIAWGNRTMIIKNAQRLMNLLGNSPADFVLNYKPSDLTVLAGFTHRTFNGIDLSYFVQSLRNIYVQHGGLENIFSRYSQEDTLQESIHHFKRHFFELEHASRTTKHIADPRKGSAAKRLNMFLRWMVRKDHSGVDFGIWTTLNPEQLSCPLDVHSGRVARKLRLLNRNQNDAKAVQELDMALRKLDPKDPVKYDYALFGLGVFEKF